MVRRTLPFLPVVVSLLALALLALLPSTSWLLRWQLGLLFLPEAQALWAGGLGTQEADERALERFRSALRKAAERHPEDYQVQLGNIFWRERQPYRALKELVPRFGREHPALYAHLLRFALWEGVELDRPEELLVMGRTPSLTAPPPPADLLAEFDRFAQQGARLDPDNAYFPMMRAVGLFAARRDQEALRALRQASRCTRWDDYRWDESMARIALLRAAFGHSPALVAATADALAVFPHLGELRSLARVVLYFAYRAERAGRQQEGAELRLALFRCGHLMRVHASSPVANLTGMALSAIATGVTTGVPPPGASAEERREWYRGWLRDHLRRMGKTTEAAWVEREFREMDSQHALLLRAIEQDRFLERLSENASLWTLNLFLIQVALAIVPLWAIYTLVARTSFRGGGEPYVLLPIVLLLMGFLLWGSGVSQAASALLGALQDLQEEPELSGWLSSVLARISGWLVQASPAMVRLLQVAAVLVVTLLLAGASALLALLRPREDEAALVTGLRRYGLSLVGVLLLLYALSVLYTAQNESVWKVELSQRIQHESRFLLQRVMPSGDTSLRDGR